MWQVSFVGLCSLVSIAIFIVFELCSAFVRGKEIQKLVSELEEAGKIGEYPAEYGKASRAMEIKFLKKWPWFFYSAIFFALLAAVMLAYAFIAELIRLFCKGFV